jgi:hypothetical protein
MGPMHNLKSDLSGATQVDQRNDHWAQPPLCNVATGSLRARETASLFRSSLSLHADTRVFGTMVGISLDSIRHA